MSLSVGNIGGTVDAEKIKETLQGKDILESVKTAEEIRKTVKKGLV